MSLQREYLLLLPTIAGIFIFSCVPKNPCLKNLILKNLAVGLCFGVAATMKPHAAIGLFPIVVFDFLNDVPVTSELGLRARKFLIQTLLPIVAGFLLPFLAVMFYLWAKGDTKDFLDVATHYWPLYTHLSGDHRILHGLHRILYLYLVYRNLGGLVMWLVPAIVGSYIALYESELTDEQKRQVRILIGLAACYSLYPIFAGQFWQYHWLPFLFFIVQVSSLCCVEQPENAPVGRQLYPIGALLFVLFQVMPSKDFMQGLRPPKEGRVDEIVAILKPRLHIGDTVQPLDWTSGAVHAMLILKVRIATPFIYDFHFYHDTSNPYIQGLRGKFLADMRRSRPRFVIDMFGEFKPWVTRPGTTRSFKALKFLLDENYVIAFEGKGYRIYELRQANPIAVPAPQRATRARTPVIKASLALQ